MPDATAPIAGYAPHFTTLPSGLTIRVLDTGGDKPALLLVHGLSASIEAWRDVIVPFADAFRVVAFDLPGFGFSDKPRDADYRAESFFVPVMAEVMDALELSRAHMVGSSMGASLVVRFAARHPGRGGRVVLANPGGFGGYIHPFLRVPTTPSIGAIMSRPQRATNAFAMRLTLANPQARTKALLDEIDAFSKMPGAHHAFVQTLRGVAGWGGVKDRDAFEADFAAMTAPALVVWGGRDKLFPVRQLERAKALKPGVATHVMPGVGHFPQIDAPAEFADAALDFLTA